MKLLFLIGSLILNVSIIFGQLKDSIILQVDGVESEELLDFYRFENINYFKLKFSSNHIKEKYFLITSNEFWNGVSTKIDTIANTKLFELKNGKDTLNIRIMSKKIKDDTIKFQFHLPRFSTIKKYKTTIKDSYSLRDITTNGKQVFSKTEPINFLVYSLPYEDPNMPGYLFYCKLSRDGTPPEKWGDVFGVEHYIIFEFHLTE